MMAVTSLMGGLAGSVILLATPSELFDLVLPRLLLAATLALCFGKALSTRFHGEAEAGPRDPRRAGIAGDLWRLFRRCRRHHDDGLLERGHESGPEGPAGPRTLLVTAANTAAIVIFALMGAVRWDAILLLAPLQSSAGISARNSADDCPPSR